MTTQTGSVRRGDDMTDLWESAEREIKKMAYDGDTDVDLRIEALAELSDLIDILTDTLRD